MNDAIHLNDEGARLYNEAATQVIEPQHSVTEQASIDTPQFRSLTAMMLPENRRELIAHIDARASTATSEQASRYKAQRDELIEFIKNADVSSGVCCGDDMDDHAPVDMWDHSVRKLIESINNAGQ